MKKAGIVLCGGQSRRMGRPKEWLPFDGEFMLQRIVRLVSEVAAPVVVVAQADQVIPPLPSGIIIEHDEVKGQGPLLGLAAGLKSLANQCEAAFLSSCDVPFLKPAFIERMAELLGDQQIAVPFAGGRPHPLAAVYRMDVLPTVRELAAANLLRMTLLLERCSTRFVNEDELAEVDPEMQSLRNVNSPSEYSGAARQVSESTGA